MPFWFFFFLFVLVGLLLFLTILVVFFPFVVVTIVVLCLCLCVWTWVVTFVAVSLPPSIKYVWAWQRKFTTGNVCVCVCVCVEQTLMCESRRMQGRYLSRKDRQTYRITLTELAILLQIAACSTETSRCVFKRPSHFERHQQGHRQQKGRENTHLW